MKRPKCLCDGSGQYLQETIYGSYGACRQPCPSCAEEEIKKLAKDIILNKISKLENEISELRKNL